MKDGKATAALEATSMFKTIARFFNGKVTGHRHEFTSAQGEQIAAWSKRGDGLDNVYFRGSVWECRGCGKMLFRPNDPKLCEVEVTR